MKRIPILLALMFLTSCSHKVMLNKQQSTLTYNDRLPTKVGIFIPAEVSGQNFTAVGSGNNCQGHSYEMESLGNALAESIRTGAETACAEVVQLSSMPTAQSLKGQGIKIALVPRLNNVNGDVTATAQFWSTSFKGSFQASVTGNIINDEGKTVYSFTSNGSGFNTTSGTCGDGAIALQKAAEMALQQIADNIAQSMNSASQIRDAIK